MSFAIHEVVDVLLTEKMKSCCDLDKNQNYWLPAEIVQVYEDSCDVTFDDVAVYNVPQINIRQHVFVLNPYKEFLVGTIMTRLLISIAICVGFCTLLGISLYVIYGPFMTKMNRDNTLCHLYNEHILESQIKTVGIVEYIGYSYIEYSYMNTSNIKSYCKVYDDVSDQRVGTSRYIVYLRNQSNVCQFDRDDLRLCDDKYRSDIVFIVFMTLLLLGSGLFLRLCMLKYSHATNMRKSFGHKLVVN